MDIYVMTSHHQPSRVVRILSPLLTATNVSNLATRTYSVPDLADSPITHRQATVPRRGSMMMTVLPLRPDLYRT